MPQEGISDKKILVIEDETALLYAFQAKFSLEKYKVITAMDGRSGLRIAKTIKPDLILLDLILPDINGFEILKALKTEKSTKSIPVIIVSNLGDKPSVEKGLELGAVDYIPKPSFKLDEIVEKIKKYLGPGAA